LFIFQKGFRSTRTIGNDDLFKFDAVQPQSIEFFSDEGIFDDLGSWVFETSENKEGM